MTEEIYRIEMERRATDERLQRECEVGCPGILNEEEITRLKFPEIFKAESSRAMFCTCVNRGDFYCS